MTVRLKPCIPASIRYFLVSTCNCGMGTMIRGKAPHAILHFVMEGRVLIHRNLGSCGNLLNVLHLASKSGISRKRGQLRQAKVLMANSTSLKEHAMSASAVGKRNRD